MQKLKYLFTVQYKDGNSYSQNIQDVSVKDPERSSFYDVDIPNVDLFSLSNDQGFFCVDLQSGYFRANDAGWFRLHKEREEELVNRRLIYFRRVIKDFLYDDATELATEVTYFIGWQANTLDGKNVQYTIEVT